VKQHYKKKPIAIQNEGNFFKSKIEISLNDEEASVGEGME